MGAITGRRLNAQIKEEILVVIAQSQQAGVSARRSCALLMLSYRRVARWQKRRVEGRGLTDAIPGPRHASHRLLGEEIASIAAMARSDEYVDLSHRTLAVTAWEKGLFFASFSSVYRVMREHALMGARGPGGAHNGRSLAPVRKPLTGANQRWCWDISYLPTFEKGVYLFLYLLLDEYSRKAVQWRVSWQQDAVQSRELLEGGLIAESILDLPEEQRPEILNDRGRQMKAKPIQRLCEDHHMPQLFARPRTPNDNAFIESAFSTVKRAPEYPGRFRDDGDAVAYFERYFDWYNNQHYHCGIDYVTPHQAHCGQRTDILARRHRLHQAQREKRRAENQKIAINHHPAAAAFVA